jgi:hypothetical protein
VSLASSAVIAATASDRIGWLRMLVLPSPFVEACMDLKERRQ